METALAAIRFTHFVAAMFVFGVGIFLFAFPPRELGVALSPRLRRWAIVGGLVAFATSLAWLALESAAMNDDVSAALSPSSIGDVLNSTAFGAVWSWRIALAALTLVALIASRVENWGAPTLSAALLLASLALVDHAAMQTGALGWIHRANDAVHLLTTGGWLGGLAPFVMCLNAASLRNHRDAANLAMLRFSAVGHVAVLMILATGAINVALTSHALPWPATSPYRALLLAKIGVVLVMLALAGVNRYALLPRLGAHPGGGLWLRGFALVEFGLGLAAVALVSYFGLLDPA